MNQRIIPRKNLLFYENLVKGVVVEEADQIEEEADACGKKTQEKDSVNNKPKQKENQKERRGSQLRKERNRPTQGGIFQT